MRRWITWVGWVLPVVLLVVFVYGRHMEASLNGLQSLDAPEFQNGYPANDPAWQKVMAAYTGGKLEDAANLLSDLKTRSDQSLLALRNLAVVRKDLGDNVGAIHAYNAALALDRRDASLWSGLGWVYAGCARWQEAEEAFRQALALKDDDAVTLLGLGMSIRQRDAGHAVTLFRQATHIDSTLALAYSELGMTLLALRRIDEGLQALEQAVKLDGNLTFIHPVIARVYQQRGDVKQAWASYQKAQRTRPSDKELQADIDRFVAQNEAFLRTVELAEAADRARVQPTAVIPLDIPDAPLVHVGLVENSGLIRMAWGAPLEIHRQGKVLARLKPGGIWTLSRQGSLLRIHSEDGSTVFTGEAPWEFIPSDPHLTTVIYDLEMGRGYFYARQEHRHYRGSFEALLHNGGITLVNVVDLESYLLSVVPSEMYTTMPLEALKAQAIAARTYTLRSMGRFRSRGFDVMGSAVSSEYRGVGKEHPRTTAAVMATTGLVLKEGTQFAETFYTATSGGYSVASDEMWGGKRSYLKATLDADVPGPEFPLGPAALERWIKGLPAVFSSQSSFTPRANFRWITPVPAGEIETRVNARKPIGRLLRVVARKRSVGGHVLQVDVIGTQGTYRVSGDSIRSTLGGLRSNLFKVETYLSSAGTPTAFVFYGGGYGHGVGFDQLGASGMAEKGYPMADILQHYFGTARLVHHY